MTDLKTQIVNLRNTAERLQTEISLAYPGAGACTEALENACDHLSDAEDYLQEYLDDPESDEDDESDDDPLANDPVT